MDSLNELTVDRGERPAASGYTTAGDVAERVAFLILRAITIFICSYTSCMKAILCYVIFKNILNNNNKGINMQYLLDKVSNLERKKV
jgi:hypothetical protein